MARRTFAAGCWVLIALGLVHLLGHYSMVTSVGQNETERQLLEAMRGYRQDMGAGFVRSTFDILTGFSLAFSVFSGGVGLLGLALMRRAPGFPAVLRSAAIVLAGVFGIMSVVGFVYWFIVPLAFLAAAFLCFVAALALAPRAG